MGFAVLGPLEVWNDAPAPVTVPGAKERLLLAVLTAIELGVAFLGWSKLTLALILIALAVWKAVLVALYYMHLRFEPNRLRLLAVAPIPLAFILVLAVIQEY